MTRHIVWNLFHPADANGELLFSDMESSPVGAFVWLYGTDIPATPTVMLGSTQCSIKVATAEWLPSTQTSLALDRVCITIPSFSGTQDLTIIGCTGSISFSLSSGSVYEVNAPNGIVMNNYSSGDRVYLRTGTYTTEAGNGGIIYGNTSPNMAVCGYPGETATIDISTLHGFDVGASLHTGTIHLSNLKFLGDNTNVAIRFEVGGHHTAGARVVGNLIEGSGSGSNYEAINIGRQDDIYVLANSLLNNGQLNGDGHEIYDGGWTACDNVQLSWNHTTGYQGRFSFEFYGHNCAENLTNLKIEHNMIDRSNDASDGSKAGIALGGTDCESGPFHCVNSDGGKWIVDALVNANTIINMPGAAGACTNPSAPTTNSDYRCSDIGGDFIFTNNYSDRDSFAPCCYNSLTNTGNSWN